MKSIDPIVEAIAQNVVATMARNLVNNLGGFGSVDYYRSELKGYRAHGRQLKIAAVMQSRGEEVNYDYLVSQFYID